MARFKIFFSAFNQTPELFWDTRYCISGIQSLLQPGSAGSEGRRPKKNDERRTSYSRNSMEEKQHIEKE